MAKGQGLKAHEMYMLVFRFLGFRGGKGHTGSLF